MEMIYRQTGFNNKEKRLPGDSLQKLAGGWSKKDEFDFLESIKSCEQIDTERQYQRMTSGSRLKPWNMGPS
jgi:hypothetical protein